MVRKSGSPVFATTSVNVLRLLTIFPLLEQEIYITLK